MPIYAEPNLHTDADLSATFVSEPARHYLMLDVDGPRYGSEDYDHALGALFAVSYGCRFALTPARQVPDYGPLVPEALLSGDPVRSDRFTPASWTLMVVQPRAITPELVDRVRRKVPVELADQVRLERFAEGSAAQMLHRGPLDAIEETADRLEAFISGHDLVPTGRRHEIYVTDPRRAMPERIRAIIRQPVMAPGAACRGRWRSRRAS